MKISKTGTALALGALACALPASAQLDMTAARDVLAAIQKVRADEKVAPRPAPKSSARTAHKKAPAALPTAPEDAWQKIVERLKTKGKFDAGMFPFKPASFGLEDVQGAKDADHATEYVSVFGVMNDDEQFEAKLATFVSEKWTKSADGNWHIDQWIFRVDLYGEVQRAAHGELVETADRGVVSENEEKLAPGDPKIAAKYASLIERWAAPQP